MRRYVELDINNKKKRYNGAFKETKKAPDYENMDFTVILEVNKVMHILELYVLWALEFADFASIPFEFL